SSIPVTYSYASLGLNNTLDYQTSNSWTDSTALGSSKVVTSISNQADSMSTSYVPSVSSITSELITSQPKTSIVNPSRISSALYDICRDPTWNTILCTVHASYRIRLSSIVIKASCVRNLHVFDCYSVIQYNI
ncbi:hypothetical protein TrispH2_012069, partial [Trichoplax sp. H2]